MKRIAGTFVLLVGLGGCVSFTAQPGTAEKKPQEVRPTQPTPPYQLPQAAYTSQVPTNTTWAAHPDHRVSQQPTTAAYNPTNYSPLPSPPPVPQRVVAPTYSPPPAPTTVRQPANPAPNSMVMQTPATPTGNTQPPAPLQIPPGMPMAVTPPSERVHERMTAEQALAERAYRERLQAERALAERELHERAISQRDSVERQVNYTASPVQQETILQANRMEPKRSPTIPTSNHFNTRNTTAEPRMTPMEPTAPSKGGMPLMRLVNTKRITLNFEVKDVGPSGLSSVELWYTQDCREWKKYDAPTQAQAYVIEVDEEGMYGFTLLAKSGIGLGKEPPAPGDQPQVWVIVDLSKPDVQLTEVTPTTVGRNVQVALGWRASDKNMGRQPITLYYAEKEDGPWKVVAANLENSGKYLWQAPPGLARVFFKVEACDLAGNVGSATSGRPVLLDNSMPTVSITNVDSAPMP